MLNKVGISFQKPEVFKMRHVIINGVGIGVFIALFASIYLKEFMNLVMPITLVYGILAPLISAVFVTIFMLRSKEEKQRAEKELFEGFQGRS